jgi:hypothetical protein
MRRGSPRFNMVGQKMPDSLHDMAESISPGLVKRLHRYGLQGMADAGFEVAGWICEIYTMDGDDRPANRSYCVEFTNSKGGMLGVQGILTHRGYPCLDHGLIIDSDRIRKEREAHDG